MAVYTTVDDLTLAAFLSAYDLGNVLSFAGIAEGVENSNYLLRTDKAHYILTLYEKRVGVRVRGCAFIACCIHSLWHAVVCSDVQWCASVCSGVQ